MILAVANQKGGVGKTSVSLGLAATAAEAGMNVLLVDLDPQANSTESVGATKVKSGGSVGVMLAEGGGERIVTSDWKGVDVMPSGLRLAKIETDNSVEANYRLKEAVAAERSRYDIVIIDMPPSLGKLLQAGLVAAERVLFVTDADKMGIEGIVNISETAKVIKQYQNAGLEVAGVVINKLEGTKEQRFREEELRDSYGDRVLGTIPKRTALPTLHAASLPITTSERLDGREDLVKAFASLASTLGIV